MAFKYPKHVNAVLDRSVDDYVVAKGEESDAFAEVGMELAHLGLRRVDVELLVEVVQKAAGGVWAIAPLADVLGDLNQIGISQAISGDSGHQSVMP